MGHNDLGELLYERGDLQGAFKCWVRSKGGGAALMYEREDLQGAFKCRVRGRDYSAPTLPALSPSPGICLPPLPRIITLLPKP